MIKNQFNNDAKSIILKGKVHLRKITQKNP